MDADDLDESERIIREIADQFDADTGRQFSFVLTGERAQIYENSLDDSFNLIDNFCTIYTDLDQQLEFAGKYQRDGFPPRNECMTVQCIGLTYVEGVWLRFNTRLTEAPDEEHHYSTTFSLTTLEQHGPLTTWWLEDHLDHPTSGVALGRSFPRVRNKISLNLRTDLDTAIRAGLSHTKENIAVFDMMGLQRTCPFDVNDVTIEYATRTGPTGTIETAIGKP